MVTKIGTAGADNLVGTNGVDTLNGLGGNDQLTGGKGADGLDGGASIDTVHYDSAASGVNVDLLFNEGTAGDAAGDRLLGFENVVGSKFADIIRGNNIDNVLIGGTGADQLDGAGGIDTADYAGAKQGVLVSLLETTGFGGDAFGDRYTSIENVTGSGFDDELEGDSGVNVLKVGNGADHLFSLDGADTIFGGAGADLVAGGAGGDVLDGGASVDTLDYSASPGGVFVDLAANKAGAFVVIGEPGPGVSDAAGDTISGFENVTGSARRDVLIGSDAANRLSGGAGDDGVAGGLGQDELTGGTGADDFGYHQTAQSGVTAVTRDLIRDFRHADGDTLELIFDADPNKAGIQELKFIGLSGFTAAGQARFFFEGDHTVVAVNTVGSSGAEMQIQLDGHVNLVSSDFVFSS